MTSKCFHRLLRHASFGLLCIAPLALAQVKPLPPFRALCVSDKETGFNWKAGDWVPVNFKAGTKVVVQKLDLATYESKPFNERPMRCTKEEMRTGELLAGNARGCYHIKEMGMNPPLMFNAEVCEEKVDYSSGMVELVSVKCGQMTFHPDGGFIRLPSHDNVSRMPPKDYKDSLVLSVGKCSRLD